MSNLKLPNLSYAALDAALPARSTETPRGAGRSHTIGYKTTAYRFQNEICIQHHGTTIAVLADTGSVYITNDGYSSSTTRARLHSILTDNRIRFSLGQRDFVQVLTNRDDNSDTYRGFVSAYFSPAGDLLAFNGQGLAA